MRILRQERKLSRGRAILWGLKSRAKSTGIVRSVLKTTEILAIDCFRCVLSTSLRLTLIVPLGLARKAVDVITGRKRISLSV
jgi:hypothetical protein